MALLTLVTIVRHDEKRGYHTVACCSRPDLVRYVAEKMLEIPETETDPVLVPVDRGRRDALRVIAGTR